MAIVINWPKVTGRMVSIPDTSLAVGDIIVLSATTPAWARLAVGAAGTVLVGGSTPAYSATPQLTRLGLGAAAHASIQLIIGGGGQTSLQGMQGIYVNPNSTQAQVTAEDSSGVEGGFFVNSSGTSYMALGTWSNHPLFIRLQNAVVGEWFVSSGLHIGTTPADPGAGVLNAQVGLKVAGAAITSMLASIKNSATVAASTTAYMGHGAAGFLTEAGAQNVMTKAGTLSRLYISTNTAQPASGAFVFTVRKNGAPTTVTLTIAAGAAAGVFSDITHSFTYAAGDLISVEGANVATATSAAVVGFSYENTI